MRTEFCEFEDLSVTETLEFFRNFMKDVSVLWLSFIGFCTDNQVAGTFFVFELPDDIGTVEITVSGCTKRTNLSSSLYEECSE